MHFSSFLAYSFQTALGFDDGDLPAACIYTVLTVIVSELVLVNVVKGWTCDFLGGSVHTAGLF